MIYSVFSKGKKLKTSAKITPFVVLHLQMLGIVIFTYHLTTLKYQKIYVSNVLHFKTILIDGPDFGAVLTVIHPRVTCLTTFQCLFQVEMQKQNPAISSFSVSYAGRKAAALEWRHFQESNFENVPTKACKRKSKNFCVLLVSLPKGFYLNISVVRMIFEGLSTDECKFGGLSFYDGKQHVVDMCRNRTGQVPPRHIGIAQRTARLVSYSYTGISHVHTNLVTHLSKCKPIRFDVCNFNFYCAIGGQISNCINYLENVSNNSALQFELATDRFSRRHWWYTTIISLNPQVQCAVIQLSSDFKDRLTEFHDDGHHDIDYCEVHFFPKPIGTKQIGIQFILKGFVENTDAAPIPEPISLDGQADVFSSISISWNLTEINSTTRN